MAPPAKRRRRIPLEDSSDQDEQPRSTNTLSNFLLSSPTSPVKPRASTAPASPLKSKASAGQSAVRTLRQRSRPQGSQHNGSNSSPKKPKDNKRVEDKGKTADLKALFSKQAQRATKPVKTAEKSCAHTNDPISDPISEDDEISELKASSSSLVGQHARKRLRNNSDAALTGESAGAGLRFLRPTKAAHQPAGVDDNQRPWSERFGPRKLDELAVHKKKVADVRKWLDDVLAGRLRQRVLILKGAAGSGKTTTVRLLADDMACELLEWKNPTATTSTGFVSSSALFEEFLGRGGKFGALDVDDSASDAAPQVKSTGGVGQAGGKRIILIEEFPNTFSRSSSALHSFRGAILSYLAVHTPSLARLGNTSQQRGKIAPLVLVISETLLTTTSASADSLTAHRLFGPDILRHPGVGVIEFNAIAPTILAKALELVVVKEARKSGRRTTPGPQVLKRLGEIGDIRNAISSLEFLCLKGDQDSDWGAKVTFTRPKKNTRDSMTLTPGETQSLELISQREASLGMFHAVGKVVYNKRDEAAAAEDSTESLPPFLSQQARPKRSQVSVDSLIDETGTDTHTFISALHENYILSCESSDGMDLSTPMDYVNGCIDYLSESDLLCPSRDVFFGGRGGFAESGSHMLRQDEMTFQVAVRGMLFSLPSPVKRKTSIMAKGSDAFRMFYPTSLRLWKAKEEMAGLVDILSCSILKGESHMAATMRLTDGAGAYLKTQAPGTTSTTWMQRQQQARTAAAAAAVTATSTAARQAVDEEGRRQRQRQRQQAEGEEEGGEEEGGSGPSPLFSLGSAARRELLLERLPYMAHIARGSKAPGRLREIEKVVSFRGVSAADDEEPEAEDEAASGEAWATDRPIEEASPRKRRAGIKGGAVSSVLTQKLVLSDDDIED